MIKRENKPPIRRGDLWLLMGGLTLGLILCIVLFFVRQQGMYVYVYLDREVYGFYPLHEERCIRIETDAGVNELTISDGKASITYADCKNQICVHHTEISQKGETIVCVPHNLWIEIK